jgi:hypothetical protein
MKNCEKFIQLTMNEFLSTGFFGLPTGGDVCRQTVGYGIGIARLFVGQILKIEFKLIP